MSEAVTVQVVFEGPRIYEAPVFQRRYSWSEGDKSKGVDRYWDDIADLEGGTAETLFLGAIITKPSSSSSTTRAERCLLVDGQQRLATLMPTLVAVAKTAAEYQYDDLVDTIIRDLITVSTRSEDAGLPKVIVTTPDLAEYEEILRELKHAGIRLGPITKVRPTKLTGSYLRARAEIRRRIEAGSSPRDTLVAFLDLLLGKTELVEVQLASRHDASEVFDRLNRGGTPLTVADLVRNHVFGIVAPDRALALAIHQTVWEPFEASFADAQALSDYFFPFTLLRDPQATKGRALEALEKRWAEFAVLAPKERITAIVNDLKEFVPAFLLLRDGAPYPGLPAVVMQAALDLWRMRLPSVVLPFPMAVLRAAENGSIEPAAAVESLRIVESFLVRRSFQGLEATGLHVIFKALWGKTEGDPATVRDSIETTTIHFPTDDEFRIRVQTGNLYGRRLQNFVLSQYEREIRAKGDALSEAQLTEFHIDHVAPQSLRGDWASIFQTDDDRALLDTWGNLVPLSQKANSTKNTMNWGDAKALLQRDTLYKSTRIVYEDHQEWTPQTVTLRNQGLAEWALKRWPSFDTKS